MQPTLIKTGNRNLILDLQSNQLTFLDNRFYITEGGDFVPSVTTYLDGGYPKSAQFFEWLKKTGEDADAIRDEAGNRGSIVHKLTEDFDNGLEVSVLDKNGYIGFKLNEWAMFSRYVEFRQRFNTLVIHNELNLVSQKLQMGGTIDRVMQVEGKTLLIDIKTSNSVHNQYWLQLAAYRELLRERMNMEVDGIAILHLNAKTRTEGKAGQTQGKGWQLCTEYDEKEISKYWNLFKCAQQLWLTENGDQKPKHISYQLTHKYQDK